MNQIDGFTAEEGTEPAKHRSVLPIAISVTLLLLLVAAGFWWMINSITSSGTVRLPNGVRATVRSRDIGVSMRSGKNEAKVETAGHEIIFTPDDIFIDGKQVGKFDESTKELQINVDQSSVIMTSEGKEILTYP